MSDCQSSDSIGYHTINQLSIDNWMFGKPCTILGRCTRGWAIRYTVISKCALGSRWEFAVGVDGLCHFLPGFHLILYHGQLEM